MKTIGYKERIGKNAPLHLYVSKNTQQKRHDRIREALTELKMVGNIVVYLIDGNKIRKINVKGY